MVQVWQKKKADQMKNRSDKIRLAHGGGGRLANELITKTILPGLGNVAPTTLTDSADLIAPSTSLGFTTDSFVVKPLFFNGGDIGKLSVCGTVNDLAVAACEPIALSLSLIIEDGFAIETLEKILTSAAETAATAGVKIATGDTKVVEAGAADGIFINTAGIGAKVERADIAFDRIKPGDKIIINGTIGDHGMTIMSQRENIKFDSPLESDCAPLNGLVAKILQQAGPEIKFMRDPTRGGCAAVLNEIATSSCCDIEITEADIPINPVALAAAEALGLDLLNIANEGKVIIIASPDSADAVVSTCRNHPLGKKAAIIGTVTSCCQTKPMVELITKIGGRRVIQMPYGRELPRIC
jgi:hydrogenase expression/formation protein HypE